MTGTRAGTRSKARKQVEHHLRIAQSYPVSFFGAALRGFFIHGHAVIRVHADTNAGRDEQLVTLDIECLLQGIQQFLRNAAWILVRGIVFENHHEFVATETGYGVTLANQP